MEPDSNSCNGNDFPQKISQSANFIIVLDSLILTAYIAILTRLSEITKNGEIPTSILNVTIIQSAPPVYYYNITPIFSSELPNAILQMNFLLHFVTIVPIFISIAYCIAAIDTDIWRWGADSPPNERKGDQKGAAKLNYRRAGLFFTFGLIGVYSYSFSIFLGTVGAFKIWWICFLVAAIYLFIFGAYKNFTRSTKETVNQEGT